MDAIRVTKEEYSKTFSSIDIVYNTPAFSELNAAKCREVHYILFADGNKPRLGITLGERDDSLSAPFSAPFASPVCNSEQKIEHIVEAVSALQNYAAKAGKPLRLTLPPTFYSPALISKTAGAIINSGGECAWTDYNYHYPTRLFADFEANLSRNARNKFRHSMEADFSFAVFSPDNREGAERCYNIIKANREAKGYPLRMTFNQVWETLSVVAAEFMLLSLGDEDVAAAQVFFPSPGIAQVIYWGDKPGYNEFRPMNRLPYEVFRHLSDKVRIIDIGPSSEEGVANTGLCEYKESLGCVCTLKPTFILQ